MKCPTPKSWTCCCNERSTAAKSPKLRKGAQRTREELHQARSRRRGCREEELRLRLRLRLRLGMVSKMTLMSKDEDNSVDIVLSIQHVVCSLGLGLSKLPPRDCNLTSVV
jgi:hypothetical protein